MLVGAGFDDAEVETRVLPIRVPPPTDFLCSGQSPPT